MVLRLLWMLYGVAANYLNSPTILWQPAAHILLYIEITAALNVYNY